MNADTRDATDGYYIIRWRGTPFTLQKPTIVEGMGEEPMPVGTIVCEGQYCDRLDQNPHWYHHDYRAPTKLFRLQYILAGGIKMEPYKVKMTDPPKNMERYLERWQSAFAERDLKRVPDEAVLELQKEAKLREGVDLTELDWTGRNEPELEQPLQLEEEDSDDDVEAEEEPEDDEEEE